jgi:hypothetical protein
VIAAACRADSASAAAISAGARSAARVSRSSKDCPKEAVQVADRRIVRAPAFLHLGTRGQERGRTRAPRLAVGDAEGDAVERTLRAGDHLFEPRDLGDRRRLRGALRELAVRERRAFGFCRGGESVELGPLGGEEIGLARPRPRRRGRARTRSSSSMSARSRPPASARAADSSSRTVRAAVAAALARASADSSAASAAARSSSVTATEGGRGMRMLDGTADRRARPARAQRRARLRSRRGDAAAAR